MSDNGNGNDIYRQAKLDEIRRHLAAATFPHSNKIVIRARDCYLELSDDARLQIEKMVIFINHQYKQREALKMFGTSAAFELLVMSWIKLPKILGLRLKKMVIVSTNGNKPSLKIKDRPQWFCWTCREWHKSDTELASCPLCGAGLEDDGPAWAGWRWG